MSMATFKKLNRWVYVHLKEDYPYLAPPKLYHTCYIFKSILFYNNNAHIQKTSTVKENIFNLILKLKMRYLLTK